MNILFVGQGYGEPMAYVLIWGCLFLSHLALQSLNASLLKASAITAAIYITPCLSAVGVFLWLVIGLAGLARYETMQDDRLKYSRGKTNSDGEEKRRPMTNSELRRMYYPDYMNKQEAIRQIKAEKKAYNDAIRGAGAWAGANEYVDYDGHLRKIEKGRLLDDYPNIADDGIIKKNVAPARKTNVRRSTIEIRKR